MPLLIQNPLKPLEWLDWAALGWYRVWNILFLTNTVQPHPLNQFPFLYFNHLFKRCMFRPDTSCVWCVLFFVILQFPHYNFILSHVTLLFVCNSFAGSLVGGSEIEELHRNASWSTYKIVAFYTMFLFALVKKLSLY